MSTEDADPFFIIRTPSENELDEKFVRDSDLGEKDG